jgi:uncharacterized damage-inducible protein DinB
MAPQPGDGRAATSEVAAAVAVVVARDDGLAGALPPELQAAAMMANRQAAKASAARGTLRRLVPIMVQFPVMMPDRGARASTSVGICGQGREETELNTPLAEMFRYNRWATLELLTACREVPDAGLDVRHSAASGSVRELLLHVVGGQQTFVLRTMGRQHEGELNRASPWPGFDALIAIAESTSDALISVAQGLDADSEVDLPWLDKTYRFPKSFFLVHALEHGVEHRTEIKMALSAAGIATPDLDAWSYSAVMGFGQEV